MTATSVPRPPPRRSTSRRAGMTCTLYALIAAAAALSLLHHVDHVVRGATGWPLTGEVNPFTYSLAIYPVMAVGLVLSLRGRAGPRFWSFLSTGGALFITAVHIGPVAEDEIGAIPAQYAGSAVGRPGGWVALGLLAVLVAVLAGTSVYEHRLARAARDAAAPAAPGRLGTAVARHPLPAFVLLAAGWSWSWWIPLARSGVVVEPATAAPLYVPGLLGPLVAAIVVTGLTEGRPGLRDLAARALRWRVAPRWYALALGGPLAALAVAVVVTGDVPALADFGRHPALPATSAIAAWLFAVVVNGLGEEVGWRGFALPQLQRRHSPLRAIGILTLVWAAWHAPVIGALASFRDRGLSGIEAAPLFTLGIGGLTVVLVWLVNRSGSVLVAALAHGTYNMVSATEAAAGAVGTVATILIMLAAAALVLAQLRSLSPGDAVARHDGRPLLVHRP